MSATALYTTQLNEHLINWTKSSGIPTTDQIIDAFEEGIKVGHERYDKFIKKVFLDNVVKACQLSEDLHLWLLENKINTSKTLVKIEKIDCFETLVLISHEDYMDNDKRALFYKKAISLRKENNDSTFNIEFIFSCDSADINLKNINSHGYFLTYTPSVTDGSNSASKA